MPASNFTVNLRVIDKFFDRPQIVARLGKAKTRALSLMGRDVRQAARGLIGKRAKRARPRPPGRPPKSHVEDDARASLRNILYYPSRSGESVIVGPVGLNQVQQNALTLDSQTVPEIQEFGGDFTIREESYDKGQTWYRRDLRYAQRPWIKYRQRRGRYPARPFMNPALRKVAERYRRRGKVPGLTIGPTTSAIQIGPASDF